MARFRYKGTPSRGSIVFGDTVLIRVQVKVGEPVDLTPIPPATKFEVGEDIGYDIVDERSLHQLRSDSRFEEIS